MDTQILEGTRLTVNVFGGRKVSRIAVKDMGSVVLVSKQEEYEAARRENREPLAVGIRKEDVQIEDSENGDANAKAR